MKKFIEERLLALEYNAEGLESEDWNEKTPFPLLTSCFSTIDLLGALYAGNASRNAPTVNNSKNYITDFLNYTEDEARILLSIFRHKLVHLSSPRVVIKNNSDFVTWSIYPCNEINHRKLEPMTKTYDVEITSKIKLQYNYVFNLSVKHLIEEICKSSRGRNGYIEKLKIDVTLQNNFDRAIQQIYDPN